MGMDINTYIWNEEKKHQIWREMKWENKIENFNK